MKRLSLILSIVFFGSFRVWANSCAEVSTTVPLPSGLASTWSSCGGTIPQNGDSVTIGYDLEITSSIPVSGSVSSIVVNGAAASVTWDGLPHNVNATGGIKIDEGCLATGSGCATMYAWDTCGPRGTMAGATGSTSGPSTTLTVSGVTGTILPGMLVAGINILPGTLIASGSGATWTLSQTSTGTVSGTISMASVIDYTSTGLTTGQMIFDTTGAGAPNYAVYGRVCDFIANPSAAGSLYADSNYGGGATSSDDFSFSNGVVVGGAKTIYRDYGALSLLDLTVTGNSDSVFFTDGNLTITATATGSAASETLTAVNTAIGGDTFGLAIGAPVTGTNIPANTTIASLVVYPGTSITLSNFPTGTVTGFTATQALVVTNVTQVNTTMSNASMINGIDAVHPFVVTGSAFLGDPAGTYSNGFTQDGLNYTDNIALSYNGADQGGSGAVYGINIPPGTIVSSNAISGFYQDAYAPILSASTITLSDNFFSLVPNAIGTGGPGGTQGITFVYSTDNGVWSEKNDILIADGNVGIIFYCINTGTTGGPTCLMDHDTFVGTNGQGAGPQLIGFGESGGPTLLNQFSNSIGLYDANGIDNSSATYITTGTGSVGVYNNDLFGQTVQAYCTNGFNCATGAVDHGFDNGSTIHPNAIYGDISVNPNFVNGTQYSAIDTRWINCDTSLGGTGSVANMFQTVMGGRAVNGYVPPYTPAQVVACLRAPWVPTNAAIATASSSGGYIGAMPPAGSGPNTSGNFFGVFE
jgi:hypothetical protein